MEEFNQDDAEVNAPSAVRYVILGLLILASGIIFIPLMNSHWIEYITLAVQKRSDARF